MQDKNHVNEFSRCIDVEKIAPQGHFVTITAEADECRAVAERLGLLTLDSLKATLTVTRMADGDSYTVTGNLDAAVTQECVVSLTPIPSTVHEAVSGLFVPPKHLATNESHEEIEDPLADVPEPIVNGAIDLGELVVQHLALVLDPYPRQSGIAPALPRGVAMGEDRQKPFAGLAALLKTKEKNDKKE